MWQLMEDSQPSSSFFSYVVQPPQRASVAGDGPQLLLKVQDLFNMEKPNACDADCLAMVLDEVLLAPAETVDDASLLRHQQSPKESILEYLAGYRQEIHACPENPKQQMGDLPDPF
ncbi:hypothetical protein MTO96_048416 [Rhipicephalus appendiculatus]